MIQSVGTLNYFSSWWIILECDHELGRYLRHLFFLAQHRCLKLGKPSRSELVTSQEYNERFPPLWNKYQNEEISFDIELTLGTNSNAWFCRIYSKRLGEIRAELGLGEPYVPLHLAIGYENEGKMGLTPIG